MKYSLTITDASPSELAKLLAMLGGSVTLPTATVTNTEDDETGDADAAPGTLDKSGLPWDDRIHSTPAKLTAKDVWRKRKGVDDATVAAVEAELRARMAAPAPAPVQQQPVYTPPPQQTFDPATQTQVAQPVYQPQPAPAPAPVQQPAYAPPPQSFDTMQQQPAPPVYQPQPVPAPAPAPAPQALDFNGFMMHIQTLLPSGRVDAAYLANLSQRLGISAITDLSARPDLIGQAIHTMQSEQRW